MTKGNPIFEKLSPNDIFILFHVDDNVTYVTNLNGKGIVRTAYMSSI